MESNDLFDYTSGRWIYNESLRRSERHLRFDVEEMKRLTAQCVNKKENDVFQFKKLAEGGFNRVFQASLSDGAHLVARIPYPTTAPKHYAIASEVATMDFLRAHGIPIPKVYGYSATSDNTVGAEYIVMEMFEGRSIGDGWYSMTEEERVKVMFQIAEIEGRLFSIQLPASGSIYYVEDLDTQTPRVDLPDPSGRGRFCIGAATSLNLWYGERSQLSFDRGPFTTSVGALKAGAMKEKTYLTKYGRDRYPRNRLCREVFGYQKQSLDSYLQALEDFLVIADYITPQKDSSLNQPTIRHPDLNPNNIFVSDSFDIVGLIDWQHCSILPLFLQCGIPSYFQNYGDDVSESVTKPELPAYLNELDEQQQAVALETFQRRQSHYYYLTATVKYNNNHFDALWEEFVMLKQRLFSHASSPWEGENETLKLDLMETAANWSDVVTPVATGAPPSCPVSYPQAEVEECLSLNCRMREMEGQLETTMESIGVGAEGWVPNERYALSKALEAEMKENALGFAESDLERQMLERHWPFDDQDEEE